MAFYHYKDNVLVTFAGRTNLLCKHLLYKFNDDEDLYKISVKSTCYEFR